MGAPHHRASDLERDQAAEALREHYAAGRLEYDEFEDRLQAIYAARTGGELEALTADLPELPLSPEKTRALIIARRAELRRRAMQNAGGSLTPFLLCVVIWAVSGGGFFWPAFLLIGPLALLTRVGWTLYGPAPDLDAAEAELRKDGGRHHGHRGRRHGYRP